MPPHKSTIQNYVVLLLATLTQSVAAPSAMAEPGPKPGARGMDFSPAGAQKWMSEHGDAESWRTDSMRPSPVLQRSPAVGPKAALVPPPPTRTESQTEANVRAAAIRDVCGRALAAERQVDADTFAKSLKKGDAEKHMAELAKWSGKCKAAQAHGPWNARWKHGKPPKESWGEGSPKGSGHPGGPQSPPPQNCLACGPGQGGDPPQPAMEFRAPYFFATMVFLHAGDTFYATTSNLHAPAGWPAEAPPLEPDSRLYLLRCLDAECGAGEVIASDDNANWNTLCPFQPASPTSNCFDSSFTVSIVHDGFYRLIAMANDQGGVSIGDVHAWKRPAGDPCVLSCAPSSPGGLWPLFCEQTCPVLVAETDQVLGGVPSAGHEFAPGDALLVGARQATQGEIVPTPGDEYHDSVLLAFSRSDEDCVAGHGVTCGKFRYNDNVSVGDWEMKLSKIELRADDVDEGAPTWSGRIVVGSADAWQILPGDPPGPFPLDLAHLVATQFRLLVNHRHVDQGGGWCCDERYDWDLDGLSWELERAVGSCDTVDDMSSQHGLVVGSNRGQPETQSQFPRYACRDYANLIKKGVEEWDADRGTQWNSEGSLRGPCPTVPPPGQTPFTNGDWLSPAAGWADNRNCWHARDSDNDGLADPWEIWGVGYKCTKVPTAPFWDTGVCTPLSIKETAPATGDVCGSAAYPFCFSEDLSARSGVEPDVFDVLVDVVYQTCEYTTGANQPNFCTSTHGGGPTDHHFRNEPGETQGDTAKAIFSTEPQTCFDGSEPPCQDPDRDLPYRTRLHTYNVYAAKRIDDTTGPELLAPMYSAINQSQNPRLWGRLSHQMLLNHGGSCATGGTPNDRLYTACGNDGTTFPAAVLLHELGHGLGLHHDQAKTECTDGCLNGTNVGTCNDATGMATSVPCNTSTNQSKRNLNLPSQSIMGLTYVNNGAISKAANLDDPSVTASDCQASNSRFSKGLSPCLDEAHLFEVMDGWNSTCPGPDPKTGLWRVKRLARDLKCLQSQGECPALSTFGYTTGAGPTCGLGFCQFDWNRDNQLTYGEYRFDASRGNTWPTEDTSSMCIQTAVTTVPPPFPVNGPPAGGGLPGSGGLPGGGGFPGMCTPPSPLGPGTCYGQPPGPPTDKCACNDDQLHDIDQWRRMLTVGKYTLESAATFRSGLAVYADSFNTNQSYNDAGWTQSQLPVEVVGSFDPAEQQHAINLCDPATQLPPGQTCVMGCQPGECPFGQLCEPLGNGAGAACTCTKDLDCLGNWCEEGHCANEMFGKSSCGVGADVCFGSDDSGPVQCDFGVGKCAKTIQDPNFAIDPTNSVARRSSIHLGGPGTNDHIRLVNVGQDSPIESVVASGGLHVRLDMLFRWHPNDPTRTVWKWGTTSILLTSSPNVVGPMLIANAGSASVTTPATKQFTFTSA